MRTQKFANIKSFSIMAAVSVTLLAATAGRAQSTYFHAVTNLNPVGYWPMHEVEAAAPGDIETNYGSLGPLGTGYYPDWVTGPTLTIQHQVPGALAGNSDTAAYFLPISANNPNGYKTALRS